MKLPESLPPGLARSMDARFEAVPSRILTELLCAARGVPVFGRTLDGNSSDKASNNAMRARVVAIMARHGLGPGAFVLVADSAMVLMRPPNDIQSEFLAAMGVDPSAFLDPRYRCKPVVPEKD